jgi:4-amino-4-deoxy-L-arabinose transferase-like glycosyltransferase
VSIPEERRRRLYAPVLLPEAGQDTHEEELLKGDRGDPLELSGILSERFEKWLLVLLFVLGTASVIVTSPDIGMCWDEAYYMEAGSRTLNWIEELFSGDFPPIQGPNLELWWNTYIKEPKGHPSITRFLVALGLSIPNSADFPLFAMRWPNAVLYGLTLVMLYLLARLHCGRLTARIAVVAYFFMPRIFGHAHFALTETPMIFLTVLVVYAFLRGLESRWWAILTGVFFGLALSTKINGAFLPLIVLPWAFLFHRRRSVYNVYSMIFIGPVVMFLSWPWMWDQALTHLAQYVYWNSTHSQIGVLFLGKIYNDTTEPVPWHYPLTIIALTIPLVPLILSFLGLARTLRDPQRQSVGFLFLWAALLPCLIPIVLGSPKYDGERLFVPAFPFLAILAGIGGGVLVRIAGYFDRKASTVSHASLAFLTVLGLVVVNGVWAFHSVKPYYLTYFNELAGGRKRAFTRFEMTYWGEGLDTEALRVLNATIPDGASLCPRALNIEVLRYYQRWGWLKKSIILNEDKGADYHLLQYRRGSSAMWIGCSTKTRPSVSNGWRPSRLSKTRTATSPSTVFTRQGLSLTRNGASSRKRATGRKIRKVSSASEIKPSQSARPQPRMGPKEYDKQIPRNPKIESLTSSSEGIPRKNGKPLANFCTAIPTHNIAVGWGDLEGRVAIRIALPAPAPQP